MQTPLPAKGNCEEIKTLMELACRLCMSLSDAALREAADGDGAKKMYRWFGEVHKIENGVAELMVQRHLDESALGDWDERSLEAWDGTYKTIKCNIARSLTAPNFASYLMDRDLKLAAAANWDHREAPWYGIWGRVLDKMIFDQDFCTNLMGDRDLRTTVTYSQFPLVRGIDTVDMEDDRPVYGSSNDDVFSPLSYGRDSNAPSPPDLRTRRKDIDIMNYGSPLPSTPPPAIRNTWSPESSHPMTPSPNLPRKPKRSKRIPDFAELLHIYDGDKDIWQKYLLMLVENKPKPAEREGLEGPRETNFVHVLVQTEEQVTHAFQCEDHVHIDTIGVIVALGQRWRYVEYDRRNFADTIGGPSRQSESGGGHRRKAKR
ncbi:hypothetical protein FPV67DRAFT_1679418 [Lyophyllum atratum]|nr:hypothetical protein FPV67DRAFT_1679418 [Lyophyllum atratum]